MLMDDNEAIVTVSLHTAGHWLLVKVNVKLGAGFMRTMDERGSRLTLS